MKKLLLIFIAIIFTGFMLVSASQINRINQLKVTEEHPFLIDNSWIPANQLKVGDLLTTIDGKKARITSVEDVSSSVPFLVYNLEDENYHNYVSQGIIVHNSGLPPGVGAKEYVPDKIPDTLINKLMAEYEFTQEEATQVAQLTSRISQMTDQELAKVVRQDLATLLLKLAYKNGFYFYWRHQDMIISKHIALGPDDISQEIYLFVLSHPDMLREYKYGSFVGWFWKRMQSYDIWKALRESDKSINYLIQPMTHGKGWAPKTSSLNDILLDGRKQLTLADTLRVCDKEIDESYALISDFTDVLKAEFGKGTPEERLMEIRLLENPSRYTVLNPYLPGYGEVGTRLVEEFGPDVKVFSEQVLGSDGEILRSSVSRAIAKGQLQLKFSRRFAEFVDKYGQEYGKMISDCFCNNKIKP